MLAGHTGKIFQSFVQNISNGTFPYKPGLKSYKEIFKPFYIRALNIKKEQCSPPSCSS